MKILFYFLGYVLMTAIVTNYVWHSQAINQNRRSYQVDSRGNCLVIGWFWPMSVPFLVADEAFHALYPHDK